MGSDWERFSGHGVWPEELSDTRDSTYLEAAEIILMETKSDFKKIKEPHLLLITDCLVWWKSDAMSLEFLRDS